MLTQLHALNPTSWGIPLSDAMLWETWRTTLAGFPDHPRDVDLRGRTVLLIGSANVYTALVPWIVVLRQAGARVRVKPARGQVAALAAITEGLGADLCVWRGGEDPDAELQAFDGVNGVIAFGGAEALEALRARTPATAMFFGFGPRFAVAACERIGEPEARGLARDVALYDTRGCMSPAAVFATDAGIPLLVNAMAEAEALWPRGPISGAEAAAIRARKLLTRAATGTVLEGSGWTVLVSNAPFSPVALPRVLVVHPVNALPQVNPYVGQLGTVAGDAAPTLQALRRCVIGEMQAPTHDGTHEGVDVLGALARPLST